MEFTKAQLLPLEEVLVKRLKMTHKQMVKELQELFKVNSTLKLDDKQFVRWYQRLSYLAFSGVESNRIKAEMGGKSTAKKQRDKYFDDLQNNGQLGLTDIHA